MHLLVAALLVLASAAPLSAREAARLAGAHAVSVTARPPPVATPTPTPDIPWVQVFTTGYDLLGYTASGTYVHYGEVATDPSVIPLGYYVEIAGYGVFRAEDTGSAIIGRHIDIWFPTAAQCYQATGYRAARWSLQRSDLD